MSYFSSVAVVANAGYLFFGGHLNHNLERFSHQSCEIVRLIKFSDIEKSIFAMQNMDIREESENFATIFRYR